MRTEGEAGREPKVVEQARVRGVGLGVGDDDAEAGMGGRLHPQGVRRGLSGRQWRGGDGRVKISETIDGHPFQSSFMARGDGTQKLPVKADLRQAIGEDPATRSRSTSTGASARSGSAGRWSTGRAREPARPGASGPWQHMTTTTLGKVLVEAL